MAQTRNRRAGLLALLVSIAAALLLTVGPGASSAHSRAGRAASTTALQQRNLTRHKRRHKKTCHAAKRSRRHVSAKTRRRACRTVHKHKTTKHKTTKHKTTKHKTTKHKTTKHKTTKRKGKPTSTAPTPKPVSAPTPVTLPPTPTSPPGDPLGGDHFYVNPSDSAVTAESQLQASGQSAAAAQIEKISSQSEATWLTGDGSTSVVPGIMSAATSSGTVPVFVVYNIPWRDCGQYSSGGAASAADYEGFINTLVGELGQGHAVVIVEPDALSELSCLSSSQQQTYYQLIGYAAQHIDSDANASVYVDAGNPGWQPAATEAAELQQALGATKAGFAVNVSNFDSTASDIAYGTAISQGTGGRHFVIDTSRNGGNAASGQWCNPPGAGIGSDPTTNTGNSLVDALLWIKDVGESDGSCNGGPPAGQFWLSYALDLVANG